MGTYNHQEDRASVASLIYTKVLWDWPTTEEILQKMFRTVIQKY